MRLLFSADLHVTVSILFVAWGSVTRDVAKLSGGPAQKHLLVQSRRGIRCFPFSLHPYGGTCIQRAGCLSSSDCMDRPPSALRIHGARLACDWRLTSTASEVHALPGRLENTACTIAHSSAASTSCFVVLLLGHRQTRMYLIALA